jgi:biotin operon repressor
MATSEYISVAEARDLLGVSRTRIAKMISRGELKSEPNPVDSRGKLLLRAQVEALAAKAGKSAA